MIGMVKQEDKEKGELKKIDTIQFGRRTVKTNEPKPRPPQPFPSRPVLRRPRGVQPRMPSFSRGFSKRSAPVPMASISPAISRKAPTTKTPIATVKSDNKYDTLIDAQHASGYWKESEEKTLKKFFKGGDIKDDAVEAELGSVTDKKKAYLTLVALHVLEEKFALREIEWSLIADKGKNYLKNVGVKNPNSLLKKFTLKIKSD